MANAKCQENVMKTLFIALLCSTALSTQAKNSVNILGGNIAAKISGGPGYERICTAAFEEYLDKVMLVLDKEFIECQQHGLVPKALAEKVKIFPVEFSDEDKITKPPTAEYWRFLPKERERMFTYAVEQGCRKMPDKKVRSTTMKTVATARKKWENKRESYFGIKVIGRETFQENVFTYKNRNKYKHAEIALIAETYLRPVKGNLPLTDNNNRTTSISNFQLNSTTRLPKKISAQQAKDESGLERETFNYYRTLIGDFSTLSKSTKNYRFTGYCVGAGPNGEEALLATEKLDVLAEQIRYYLAMYQRLFEYRTNKMLARKLVFEESELDGQKLILEMGRIFCSIKQKDEGVIRREDKSSARLGMGTMTKETKAKIQESIYKAYGLFGTISEKKHYVDFIGNPLLPLADPDFVLNANHEGFQYRNKGEVAFLVPNKIETKPIRWTGKVNWVSYKGNMTILLRSNVINAEHAIELAAGVKDGRYKTTQNKVTLLSDRESKIHTITIQGQDRPDKFGYALVIMNITGTPIEKRVTGLKAGGSITVVGKIKTIDTKYIWKNGKIVIRIEPSVQLMAETDSEK